MHVIVKGGTNAGWKRLNAKTVRWHCPNCGKTTPYRVCLRCGRAKEE